MKRAAPPPKAARSAGMTGRAWSRQLTNDLPSDGDHPIRWPTPAETLLSTSGLNTLDQEEVKDDDAQMLSGFPRSSSLSPLVGSDRVDPGFPFRGYGPG